MLQFRNVDASPSDDITTWPFEALATAIDRGLVADWQPIIAEIRRAPWGAVTRRVEHHLDHRDADGTTAIFRLAVGRARHDAEQAERAEVARRGAVPERQLRRLGLVGDPPGGAVQGSGPPDGVVVVSGWWVHGPVHRGWAERLRAALADLAARDPLADGLTRGAAADLLGLPDPSLLDSVIDAAGLEPDGGQIRLPGRRFDLGPAEAAIAGLERRLAAAPFAAPEAEELAQLRLGARELAAADRAGRILRLRDGIVLLPTAPALAMRELARLPQPFTTSQARATLATTRRVAIPLLEHLDARGWTRRLDAGHREVRRPG